MSTAYLADGTKHSSNEQAKHTPGPWETQGTYATEIHPVGDEDGLCIIADVDPETRMQKEVGEANARLIAAAPELLYALKTLYAIVEGECPSLLEDCQHDDDTIRAAIAKAEGAL